MATEKLVKLSQVEIIKADSDASYDEIGAAAGVLGTASDTASDNTVYGAKAAAAGVQTALIGASGDAASANTIYGAKAAGQAAADTVLGTSSDTATDNTVYGAKAKAADVQSAVTGTSSDTSSDLTLNGVKALANEKTTASAVATQIDTALTGYATETYVGTAIGNAIATAMDWKGTVADMTALAAVSSPKSGDVYHVTSSGSEYAWNGTAWEELGVTFDATGYVQTSDIVYATDAEVRAALGQS